jgi:ribonuclease-3
MSVKGYDFTDPALLETALTHKSYANERQGTAHNERLEFLGDAVLGFLAAERLFHENPGMAEGELTKLRAGYVCEKSLAAASRRLGLGKYLRLGKGERAEGGGARDSILADAFEAVLAAIYLDGGMEPCRVLVNNEVLGRPPQGPVRDAKSRLQEILQGRGKPAPEYRTVSESGPDHRKSFVVEALIEGSSVSSGEGRSKKEAEMIAAEKACSILAHRAEGHG